MPYSRCSLLSPHSAAALATAAGAADGDASAVPAAARSPSVLPPAPGVKKAAVRSLRLDRTPVTNADFAQFVRKQPQWRRDHVAPLFADAGLSDSLAPRREPRRGDRTPAGHARELVRGQRLLRGAGARLPTWYEWEYAAAASETITDARADASGDSRSWTGTRAPRGRAADVGRTRANYYGIQDLHGVVWEWVEDLSSMLVSGDNREQSDPDALRFCGTRRAHDGAEGELRDAHAHRDVVEHAGAYTSATMGFRCARK